MPDLDFFIFEFYFLTLSPIYRFIGKIKKSEFGRRIFAHTWASSFSEFHHFIGKIKKIRICGPNFCQIWTFSFSDFLFSNAFPKLSFSLEKPKNQNLGDEFLPIFGLLHFLNFIILLKKSEKSEFAERTFARFGLFHFLIFIFLTLSPNYRFVGKIRIWGTNFCRIRKF